MNISGQTQKTTFISIHIMFYDPLYHCYPCRKLILPVKQASLTLCAFHLRGNGISDIYAIWNPSILLCAMSLNISNLNSNDRIIYEIAFPSHHIYSLKYHTHLQQLNLISFRILSMSIPAGLSSLGQKTNMQVNSCIC